ncbi:hypothetical protein BKA93DRAFT_822220 [Sparassis latifolia]
MRGLHSSSSTFDVWPPHHLPDLLPPTHHLPQALNGQAAWHEDVPGDIIEAPTLILTASFVILNAAWHKDVPGDIIEAPTSNAGPPFIDNNL